MIRVERVPQLPGVVQIVLDRPEKRNALTKEAIRTMTDAVRACEAQDDARAILLRGEGRVFSGGFDLAACVDDPGELGRLLEELGALIAAVRGSRCPAVCAAQGAALAGACALAAACDFVITHSDAKIGYPVVRIGVSPAVSAPPLIEAVGVGAARSLLLDPAIVPGERAHELGLSALCVDMPEDVVPRAQIEAGKLAKLPPVALARTKQWLCAIDQEWEARHTRALRASLALVGNDEQRSMLAAAMRPRSEKDHA